MIEYKNEILGTIIVLSTLIVFVFIVKRGIRKFGIVKSIDANRRKIIHSLSYLILYLLTIVFLAVIWGFDTRQFAIFLSSILAVLGVGFFAQWSILSNLTASVVLFFYHPVRIGDRIRVLDKDFDWTGVVTDITGFYFYIKTDAGDSITLPNSLVIQKGIQMLE